MKPDQSRTGRNTLFYFVGNLIPQLLGFLLLPVYTRYLSPSDYGIINYVAVYSLYFQQIANLALSSFVLRFYFVESSELDRRRLIGNVSVFATLWSLVVFGLAIVIVPSILVSQRIQVPFFPYFFLGLLSTLFETFMVLPLVIFRIRQEATKFVLLGTSAIILKYGASIVWIVVFNGGLLSKFYADLAVNALYLCISLLVLIHHSELNINWKQIGTALKFSVPFLVSALLYSTVDASDRLFLERVVSMNTLGIYSISLAVVAGFTGLVQSYYRAVEPSVYQRSQLPGFVEYLRETKYNFLFVIVLFGLIVSLFSSELLALLADTRFSDAATAIPILIIAGVMNGLRLFYDTITISAKRSILILYETVVGVVLILVLNGWLIPQFSVLGAAAAKVLAFSAMAVLSVLIANGFIRIEEKRENWTLIVGSVLLYLPVVAFTLYVEPRSGWIMTPLKITFALTGALLLGVCLKPPVWTRFMAVLKRWRTSRRDSD